MREKYLHSILEFKVPFLLIIAIAITQMAKPYLGDKTQFIHWNGAPGFVYEWHYWIQYVHKAQFYALTIIPLILLIWPVTTRLAKRVSIYSLVLYIGVSVVGHIDYFRTGWPEAFFMEKPGLIYVIGTIIGFFIILIIEILDDENFPRHPDYSGSSISNLSSY